GGDDPEVHSNSFHSPKAIHHLVLEDAEDLGLSGKAHVPDLVEEEGSTMRQLELPWLSLGVAAADSRLGGVAKQLALENGLGDRGAIDGHEGIRAARGPVMNRPGDQLLARSAFANDQDRRIEVRNFFDLSENLLCRRADAHKPVFLLKDRFE